MCLGRKERSRPVLDCRGGKGRVTNSASLSGKGSQGMGNVVGTQDSSGLLDEGRQSLS